MSKRLEAQILTALTAYAETNGATITIHTDGARSIQLVTDTIINLSEIARVIAKEIRS